MTTKKKLVMSYNITKKMDDQMIGLIRDGHYESKSQIVRFALTRFLMLNDKLQGNYIRGR